MYLVGVVVMVTAVVGETVGGVAALGALPAPGAAGAAHAAGAANAVSVACCKRDNNNEIDHVGRGAESGCRKQRAERGRDDGQDAEQGGGV